MTVKKTKKKNNKGMIDEKTNIYAWLLRKQMYPYDCLINQTYL